MNRFVYCPGGIVMFDRPKNSMLGPLPGVNRSRKYLRTFLCHRISFCLFSSSPFLAKKDMYKGGTIRKVIEGGGEGNSRAAGIFFSLSNYWYEFF